MGVLVLGEAVAWEGLLTGGARDGVIVVLAAVASPVEVAREGGEAVHAGVAVRQMTETDVLVEQRTR